MAVRETHFELFLRRTPRASWVLADAYPSRQQAVDKARTLLKEFPNGGVRVTKEERNPKTGQYQSITVTSVGNCEEPRNRGKGDFNMRSTSSCVSPKDLFSAPARKTYQEVLPNFLQKFRVLPGELVYRTDLLERLEASGTEVTQAIQRVAIARAGGSNELHAVARQLHEMVHQAINIAFKDKKNGEHLTFERSLPEVVAIARKKKDPTTAFSSAISHRLMKETSWPSKLSALLALWREVETLSKEDQHFCNGILSDYFTEWLDTPSAVESMLGDSDSPADTLNRLIATMEPRPPKNPHDDPLIGFESAQILAEAISIGVLPSARHRIITRVFEELSSNKRLFENDLLAEFETLKKFGDRIVLILNGERRGEMYEAFSNRSKFLMTTDVVETYLAEFDILDRPWRLLQLSKYLVGADSRAKMTALFRGYVSHNQYEVAVLGTKKPLVTLSALRTTQSLLLASDLPEQDRLHGAQDIDQLGVRLMGQCHLMKVMTRKARTPEHAALGLFKLACEALPMGQCVRLASNAATQILKTDESRMALEGNPELKATLRNLSQTAIASGEIRSNTQSRRIA